MKIITLMEDILSGENLHAEHGLSLYIETENHKILADTGQSSLTWKNAEILGIDLSKVDTVFLSHGHYDHSGGILSLMKINPDAVLIMRDNAAGEYYSFKENAEHYIGIDKNILNIPNLKLIKENTVIDDELSVFTNIPCKHKIPEGNKRLHRKEGEKYIQDDFSHEQYLVIKYENSKLALISGCAHKGILNILDGFRQIYDRDPDVVISGFHMIQNEYSEDDINDIKRTAYELQKMDTIFYTGHCTGDFAYNILKDIMGEKLIHI